MAPADNIAASQLRSLPPMPPAMKTAEELIVFTAGYTTLSKRT